MPTIRGLSETLQVDKMTIARAYQELAQEGILGASRRRGTTVFKQANRYQALMLSQDCLSDSANNLILEALSLGYTPKELEITFAKQLAL